MGKMDMSGEQRDSPKERDEYRVKESEKSLE